MPHGDSPGDAPDLLFDGPKRAPLTLALAHGAGAPMDSPAMAHHAEALAARGIRVARFEFPYMAARRQGGKAKPPDREPRLLETWRSVIATLGPEKLAIGGRSMGGRMASLLADEAGVRALVCISYPFHPPGKPENLRTAHLERIKTPTLIVQGSRDPFGSPEEVAGYTLSRKIRLHWCEDGDHTLKPRKASGRTEAQNWDEAAKAIAVFLEKV